MHITRRYVIAEECHVMRHLGTLVMLLLLILLERYEILIEYGIVKVDVDVVVVGGGGA